MSFSGFNLSKEMVNALNKLGYINPSKVQEAVIPKLLRGESVLAQSETGSGKTHAYLVPIIEKIDKHLARPQAIIIAPTRELARQIYEFARAFERFYPTLRIRLFTSESDVSDNEEGKKVPPQIIIGTPGRLKDLLITRASYNPYGARFLVLDEADMLMDMGFFEDIESIYKATKQPIVSVFSATLKQNLRDELNKFVNTDFKFESENTETSINVSHHLINIKHIGELNALIKFLEIRRPYLAIVFASTVEKVGQIAKGLKENGIPCLYYSGALDDRSRKKALREIKKNKYSVIVSSDLLSRGIDIPDVSDVISIDLPSDLEFYYHRAGRSGRFGKKGDSWVFYNSDSLKLPTLLVEAGTPFDFFVLSKDSLKEDPVGLKEKTKLTKKRELPEEEIKEIKIAKALSRPKRIEPMYKKKRQFAIEKVKKKYRKKAIQQAIRNNLAKKKDSDNY